MTDPSARPTAHASCGAANDLVSAAWAIATWWLCGAAIAAGFGTPRWRLLLWIAEMGVAGTLCLVNAARCHRTHCYITGPVYLLGALLTALNAAGITAIPWLKLGLGVVIGVGIGMLIESFAGRYAKKSDATNRS